MAYSNRATKRIKKLNPIDGLSEDIKVLSVIEHDLRTREYERESEWLKAKDLSIKAIMGRAKIRADMLDRVSPKARAVEISTVKNTPFQVELDFSAPLDVDVKLP